MNIFQISYCFVSPITTVFYLTCSKLLLHWFKKRTFPFTLGHEDSQFMLLQNSFTVCCSANLMLFFVMSLIFVGVFFSIPLLLAYDTVSDHLCVCMFVQVKVCVKGSNNFLAHTLHTEGFLFLYNLLSHYFKSPLFTIGTTVASKAFRIQYDK